MPDINNCGTHTLWLRNDRGGVHPKDYKRCDNFGRIYALQYQARSLDWWKHNFPDFVICVWEPEKSNPVPKFKLGDKVLCCHEAGEFEITELAYQHNCKIWVYRLANSRNPFGYTEDCLSAIPKSRSDFYDYGFKVGDRVKCFQCIGTIVEVKTDSQYKYRVHWDNGSPYDVYDGSLFTRVPCAFKFKVGDKVEWVIKKGTLPEHKDYGTITCIPLSSNFTYQITRQDGCVIYLHEDCLTIVSKPKQEPEHKSKLDSINMCLEKLFRGVKVNKERALAELLLRTLVGEKLILEERRGYGRGVVSYEYTFKNKDEVK